MCGIAGILDPSGRDDGLKQLAGAMADQLVHRGPDASGAWAEGPVAFGHRRLAVIDLSEAGAQPMVSAPGRFIIAFNGEIYNHLELRRELEQAGAAPAWRGHADTETLLAAIEHWGLDETLQRSTGMFAIALWDRGERRLSLARDRMGEKPLYWGWAERALVFASELKALLPHPGFQPDICRGALSQFLRFAYVPAPASIYKGIYKLEPGTILEADCTLPGRPPQKALRPGQAHGSLVIRRYWSLNQTVEAGAQNPILNEAEAVAELESTLSQAVRGQMLSDVPLGAFLSGGIDSSVIVALMQAQASEPVKTFTIGFENASFDEAPYAAAVARHLGTDHTELTVTEREALDVIPNLPSLYDEPFADSSQIPTHLVCRAARSRVTVALSGDGGDELFGGYNRHIWGPLIWRRMGWMPKQMRHVAAGLIAAIPTPAWDQLSGPSGVNRLGDKALKLAARMQNMSSVDELYRSLVTEWQPGTLCRGEPQELPSLLDDPLPASLTDDPAGKMMALDMRSYLPDDILCKVDRAAMGTSLETRVPFLDKDVLALSARLPMNMKIRQGQSKWALRQVLYRHVPRELIERPKTGFSIPLGAWLRGPLRAWADDLLSPAALLTDGLIDPAPVAKTWAEHLSGKRDWSSRLWCVLMLQSWRMSSR